MTHIFSDFDPEAQLLYRMTLALDLDGEGIVGFAAVQASGRVQDLGMAFVNLPSTTWAAVSARDSASVKAHYVSGPQGKRTTDNSACRSCLVVENLTELSARKNCLNILLLKKLSEQFVGGGNCHQN